MSVTDEDFYIEAMWLHRSGRSQCLNILPV